mmetsp:Transcript_15240/g.32788  ORF Transcript_15240/g.32788 Transcript_15240/m.32788 type:complete len:212 (+) Transcript_15240:391-1026(+)|eukprot:CAMPEP_0168177964 /NCGR_PEP_ID=MMETSP0139_2-20121125/8801_1 /TAXON_ID=44445 /ORGANISM="Pseudo-nitzschia australis, Strain 10249 10 AB" /LENGTH=211 /DNA_ID=CAMNT_0008097183 /DNA_START=375 /DNA_END=1010 /DNA_ORIENTATION=-
MTTTDADNDVPAAAITTKEKEPETGTVKLVSKEGIAHEVPISIAKMSKMIEFMLEDQDDNGEEEDDKNDCNDNCDGDATNRNEYKEICFPNVEEDILVKVIEYCRHYKTNEPMTRIAIPLESNKLKDLVQKWYSDFCKGMPLDTMIRLVGASNFMDISPLLDLACLAVSIHIKGKPSCELQTIFHLTDEEMKDALLDESPVAFQKTNNNGD